MAIAGDSHDRIALAGVVISHLIGDDEARLQPSIVLTVASARAPGMRSYSVVGNAASRQLRRESRPEERESDAALGCA